MARLLTCMDEPFALERLVARARAGDRAAGDGLVRACVRAAAAAALRGPWAAPSALAAAARRTDEAILVRQAAFEALAGEVLDAGVVKDGSPRGVALVLDILAAEVAGLAAYARSVVDDSGASFVLRGSAARLVLAAAPEAGFAR